MMKLPMKDRIVKKDRIVGEGSEDNISGVVFGTRTYLRNVEYNAQGQSENRRYGNGDRLGHPVDDDKDQHRSKALLSVGKAER
jgi:hypothetical protein